MEGSVLTEVVLPLALAFIMLGLGFSLTWADFKRAAERPVPVVVGVIGQLVMLPLLGFGIANLFGLTGALAVGLVIVSVCPGGVTSNMISFLSKGDLALSITLTAISSVITPFTVPLVLAGALTHFGMDPAEVSLPIPKTMIALIAITILPVAIGMFVRNKKPDFAKKADRPVRIASALILAIIIVAIVKREWDGLGGFFLQAGWAALALNVTSMAIGFSVSKLMRLGHPQSVTIGIEVGIQNGTTAILIAATLLQDPTMTIAPAVYSLIMFGTGAVFGFLVNYKRPPDTESASG